MTNKGLPKRGEIPAALKWQLEDIYPEPSAWEKDYNELKQALPGMTALQGGLGQSGTNLLKGLTTYAAIREKMEKLYVYAHMQKDEDNGCAAAQALLDRAQSLMVEAEGAVSFLIPEILTISPQTLDDYVKNMDALDVFHTFIMEATRQREHILPAREEQILAMTGEIAAAPSNIFNMLNNADIRFPHILDEQGDSVELTKGRYIQFMESRDRTVRELAFKALYETYGKQKNTIAAALSSSIKKDVFFAKMHKYPSDLAASLDADNIATEVYDNLITAVEGSLEPMFRYVSLRKRALGLEKLHMYDLYVPIVPDIDMKVPYAQAKEMVAKGVAPLGSHYHAILEEGYTGGWIDVMENEGKTGGAYSWGCYDTHPYVLLNYQENIDNVFTLAHEMGHAIHSYLSNKNQPYIKAGYKIFVAEVASTLNEILLTEHLLNTLTDDRQKAYIINHYLEQFRGTVYRQTMFAAFEKTVHDMASSGTPLTQESLSSVYRELNQRYYGPDMIIDHEIDLEWARIPHFYNAFYVYKYATGFCAAAALAEKILKEGQPAVDRYISFLSSGGSDYPINLLKMAGVDMTAAAPIEAALKNFGRMVDRLETLLQHTRRI